ncbi:MAG: PAS domain S-box protein [Oscillatoriales cyanobacterium SM2_1_8]|nr:PAS domain S-box protein [Oscillatoriales cyanobacterium SM2_1_8]
MPKKAEEQLYRLALAACAEPLLGVRMDEEGYPQPFWLVNTAAQRLLGYTAREFKRLSLMSLGLSRQDVRQLLQSGTLYGALGTRGGQAVYMEMRSRALEGGYFVVALQPWGALTAPPVVTVPDRPTHEGRELGVLAQAATGLSQAESLMAIASVAVESGRVLFQTQRAALLLLDRHGEARFYRAVGLSKGFQRAIEAFRREKVSHAHNSPLFFPDVLQSPFPLSIQKQLLRENVGAVAVFPLVCGDERRGELVIYYEAPHPFREAEQLLGQTLAGLVAGAIARQRRWDDLVGVLENAREVLFATDTQWHWTYLNPAWKTLTGYTVSESLNTAFLDGVHPEDLPPVLAQLERIEAGQSLPLEFRYRGRNGQYRWLEMSPMSHTDPWGQWVGIAGILRDVGDRRQMEAERQRYQETRAALAQAHELTATRSQFFAMASHEFRTPIGAILSNVNILEYACDRENPKTARASNGSNAACRS